MGWMIGLDLGTTSCKALALDARGQTGAAHQSEHPSHTDAHGSHEQQAGALWDSACAALRGLGEQLDIRTIDGICLSGAMHSLLMVGRDDQPMGPAMTWADTRPAPAAAQLRQIAALTDELYQRTGCPLQHPYHVARLRYLRERDPDQFDRADRFVELRSFILHRLTGRWVAERGGASCTGLVSLDTGQWDALALEAAGITPGRLPALVGPTDVVGKLTDDAAARTHLSAGLPIIAGSHDGGLANLGSGAADAGCAALTVGTSGAVRRVVDKPQLDPRGRTWCYHFLPGRYLAGGAINNGGLLIDYLRRCFYHEIADDERAFTQIDADALAAAPGADGLLVLPYLAGERSPLWLTEPGAALLNMTLHHTRAHLARACYESIGFCLRSVLEAMNLDRTDRPIVCSGRVGSSPNWLPIAADILGAPLQAVDVPDASARGAALLGLLATGSIESINNLPPPEMRDKPFIPNAQRAAEYDACYARFERAINAQLMRV